jgi:hypothetical protein
MKRLAIVLIGVVVVGESFRCEAQAVCARVAVQATYETTRANLTLADLLAPGQCSPSYGLPLHEAAAQVNLGAAPQLGSVRVLEGSQIRRLLEKLTGENQGLRKRMVLEVPERIVVRRSQAIKSCAEIAQFLAGAARVRAIPGNWGDREEKLECNALGGIPAASPLELSKTTWNIALQRWEFALRCVHPEQCVPFLVWTRAQPRLSAKDSAARSAAFGEADLRTSFHSRKVQHSSGAGEIGSTRLVKLGETATLSWEHSGLRIRLPVTCLDAGGMGEFVRVRFKNTPRILRAEVVGKAMLRAQL